MALQFAYALDGEVTEVKDFELTNGYTPAKGDLVTLTAGKVALPAANPTTVLGVFEGGNFRGLAGDAVTVTNNTQNKALAKVRVAPTAVYRIPVQGSAPVVGTKYGVTATANAKLDTANTTTGAIYQVVDYDGVNAFVTITGRVLS